MAYILEFHLTQVSLHSSLEQSLKVASCHVEPSVPRGSALVTPIQVSLHSMGGATSCLLTGPLRHCLDSWP